METYQAESQYRAFPQANGSPTQSFEAVAHEVLGKMESYAREKPTHFALWALGIGFVLGWKLKPW